MQVESPAPRRRPLWRLFIAPVLLLIAAAAWSAFWFYAASQVGVRADAWRAQEAKSGRYFNCGKRSVAGFPFRFEVACEDASVKLVSQTASNTLFAGQLAEILVVGNTGEEFAAVLTRLSPEQRVIDLVRLKAAARPPGYEGIAW